MRNKLATSAAIILWTSVSGVQANAASVLVTDRPAFMGASTVTTADLNSLPAGFYGSPGFIDTGLVSVATTSPLFVQNNDIFGTGAYLSAQQQENPTVTFTFENFVTAFGFDYFTGNVATLTVNGQTFNIASNPTFPSLQFAGVLSDTPFTTAVLRLVTGADIDNLSAGAAVAVPEPAAWAMMIGGFSMIGGAMRSARRHMPKVKIRFA